MVTILIALLQGCSGHALQDIIDGEQPSNKAATERKKQPNPSQNNALNSISPSHKTKAQEGILQKKSDAFIKDDWTPTIEKNSTIKTINEDESRDFKIQEYVDKAGVYINAQPDSNRTSHKEKMDKMPGIGKNSSR